MEKIELTFKQWKEFCDGQQPEIELHQELAQLCVNYIPLETFYPLEKSAGRLLEDLREVYVLIDVELVDIKSFLSKIWIRIQTKKYLSPQKI